MSLIVEKLEHHFPFEEFMKVSMETYYDFVRVISYYLTKTDNREICLVSKPQPLLEINQLVKLYKQEGKYLKLALMNQYDPDKFVGVVDCYLTEYSEFFKFLNENEYLCSLNEKIQRPEADYVADREDNIYHVDYLKRKRETTVAELSNQLLADNLEHPVEEKGCLYKCIFLLKNNIQLFVKIVDNVRSGTALENSMLEVRMESILGNDTYYLESQK